MAQEGAQEGAASERACDRCRERRVKCDKRSPSCLRCEKLGKPCPGYEKKRKFVDEGVSLRKKFQASSGHLESGQQHDGPVATSRRDENASPSFTFVDGRKTSAGAQKHDRIVSVAQPQFRSLEENEIDQSNVVSSLENPDPLLFPDSGFPAASGEADSFWETFVNDPDFDASWFDIDPSSWYTGTTASSCGFLPNIPNIVDEVDRNDYVLQSTEDTVTSPMSIGFASDNILWAPESQLQTSAIITDEREHEMAYLIRHFTEALGPWMDLFDQDKHFGNLVPLKALRDALLRNAIAAVSAKQLGRVKGNKPFMGIQSQKPAAMEVIEELPEVDWFYKAANYYDKAIAFSRIYLQAISGSMSNPSTPNTSLTISMANSDDLLVAVSIFSLYESLDNVEIGWLQHLAGLKTLLSALSPEDQSQIQATPTVGRRASFWNFARADYQAAYMNHQATLLNTEDLALWHGCGLQIQDDGSLYRDPEYVKSDPLHCRPIAELVAHTLLWLVLRVMNYLGSDIEEKFPELRQARWLNLSSQLDEWHSNLPQTFQPCAQMRYPLSTPRTPGSSASQLTEVFYTMDVCAASLQLYHFARILLLLNKPISAESSAGSRHNSASGRLKVYREISSDTIRHAHQIVGIALGRPHPAVRVEMLLPLSTAGACLEADEERRLVLELLRAIQKDTGVATETRCENLMEEWGWNNTDAMDYAAVI